MRQATRTGGGARLFRLLIYGLILVSAAAQFALIPVMPVYAHRLGLSGFQQGMVLGATGLAALAVSLPAGTLSDRFGARRLTLAAGLLMAAAMLAQALAGSFPALLAARLAFGAGYAMVWTAGLCWLADAGRGHGAAQGGRPAGHGAGQPAQAGGPHHAVAGPERQPGREQGGKVAGQGLARGRQGHQQTRGQGDAPGAEPVGQGPGRHGHDQGGEPGRAEHHPLLESG